MDLMEAVRARHSVRNYTDRPIEGEVLKALEEGAIECPDMPHSETIRVMELMDALRAQWGVKYPFE